MAEEWDGHLQPSNYTFIYSNVKIFQMLAHDTNPLNNVINLFL
jgi:hypothetical protein